MTKEMGL